MYGWLRVQHGYHLKWLKEQDGQSGTLQTQLMKWEPTYVRHLRAPSCCSYSKFLYRAQSNSCMWPWTFFFFCSLPSLSLLCTGTLRWFNSLLLFCYLQNSAKHLAALHLYPWNMNISPIETALRHLIMHFSWGLVIYAWSAPGLHAQTMQITPEGMCLGSAILCGLKQYSA